MEKCRHLSFTKYSIFILNIYMGTEPVQVPAQWRAREFSMGVDVVTGYLNKNHE